MCRPNNNATMLQRFVDIICALIGHKRRILGMYSYYRDQTKPICHKSSTFHMQSVVNIRSLEVWKGRSWIIEIVFSYHKFRFRTSLTLLITISGADVQSNSDPNLKKVHSRGIMLVHVQDSENHISDISQVMRERENCLYSERSPCTCTTSVLSFVTLTAQASG